MLLSAFRWCARCPSSLSTDLFCISSEVLSALNASRGVVALESTVITHGLPRPKNYELAVKLESIVRASNAVPATIAILDGKVHIGLSNDQLKRVAEDVESVKVSRRDIPYVVANKLVGGTTVAATMYLANKAGIRVFATGGLGGVHRGASESFDVSADLVELAQTPVTVVCAGVKSILDIPKTLEYLETNSVNVIVYGRTNKFPGFFMAETESRAPYCTYSLNSIVDIMNCSKAIGLKAGCVVACPIPAEHETHGKVIEEAMRKALLESKELDIKSKNVTPFLLKRINELTKGASVRTNIALLENNVLIGAKLANLFAEKERFEDKRKKEGEIFGTANVSKKVSIGKKPPSVVVIGATVVDFEAMTQLEVLPNGGSYPGVIVQHCGGVGRNHADALTRLGLSVDFITVIGDDPHGDFFKNACPHMNMKHVITRKDVPTATYISFNVKGNVLYGISSIDEVIRKLTPSEVTQREKLISEADFVLLDGNVTVETIKAAVNVADYYGTKVWYEPTDIAKMRKIFDAEVAKSVNVISPNANEFVSYCNMAKEPLPEGFLSKWPTQKIFEYLSEHKERYLRSLEMLVVTLGPAGSIVLKKECTGISIFRLDAPLPSEKVMSVSGAGDCFNCGLLTGILHGVNIEDSLQFAQKCARASLQSYQAVPESLNNLRILPSA